MKTLLRNHFSLPTKDRARTAALAFLALGATLFAAPAGATSFTTASVYVPAGVDNSIAVDGGGNVHVATYDPFSGDLIYGFYQELFGWTTETVAGPGNVGQYCSLAVDASGNPRISYFDVTQAQLWYAAKNAGVWTTEPVSATGFGQYSSLALDSTGRPHITYSDATGTQVHYAVRNGAVWSNQNIDAGAKSRIAVDRFDRPHFVYQTTGAPSTSIRYAVITGATTNFTTIETIASPSGENGEASIAVDVSGNPRVSYLANCQLRYGARQPDGTWALETVDGTAVMRATSIALDPDGSPRIAYQADLVGTCGGIVGFSKALRYAEKTRGSWTRIQVDSGGGITTGNRPAIAVVPHVGPVIAYGQELPQLMVAFGRNANAREMVPNAVRTGGPVNFLVYGSSMPEPPSVVRLEGATQSFDATGFGAVLGGSNISVDFDLTGADVGPYTLILHNGAGQDTIPDAVFIHDEAVDLTRLTTNTAGELSPMITPPGVPARLAFASGRETGQHLFVRDLGSSQSDLGAYRVTTDHPAEFPSWAPDGVRIAYHDLFWDKIQVTSALTGHPALPQFLFTPTIARNPSWHPVDERVAYDDGNAIYTIEVGTNAVATLVTPPSGEIAIDPDWSPDGSHLVYTRDASAAPGTGIAVYDIPGASSSLIVPEDGSQNFGAQWSPDGKWIAFSSNRALGGSNYDAWVTDSRGLGWLFPITDATTGNDAQVSWGQDGTTLSFISTAMGNQDVVLASNLPMFQDADADGVPDGRDSCPSQGLILGRFDYDFDGCQGDGSSFRFTRFWANDRMPIVFEMSAGGDPAIGDDSEFTEMDDAFATWVAAAPGISVNRISGGPENAVSGDGRNTFTFTDADGFRAGTVAITYSTVAVADTVIGGRLYLPNEIVDSDILFNTLHYDFSTPTSPGPAGSFNLQSVATHEIGHLLGMGHSSISTSTMFYVAYRGPEQESLETDDIDLVAQIYHGATLPPPFAVTGKVLRGEDGVTPVVGAAVFFISDTGDTLEMTVTGIDGSYGFYGPPFPARVFVAPLDGGATVNGLRAKDVSGDLASVADTDFLAEYYDGAAETNADYGTTGFLLTGQTIDANILTNPDLQGPQVLSVFPVDGSVNVPATTAITVQFDEKIEVNTVPGNLTLTNQTTLAEVGGQASFITPNNILIFTPSSTLDFDTQYILDIGTGITDMSGNPLADNVAALFRVQTQPPVAVLAAAPPAVPTGGTLILSGTGFSPTPGNNLVSFNGGASATPFAATLEQLSVTVPVGALSGPLTATVGPETSPPFTIQVVPPQAPPVGNFIDDVPLGGNPRKLTVVPDGSWAYVATSSGVTAVNARPPSPNFGSAVNIPLAGGSRGVAALPDGRRVLVISSNPFALSSINSDPTDLSFFNSVVQTIALPAEPLGIVVTPGGSEALVVYANSVVAHSTIAGASFGLPLREWNQTGLSFVGDIGIAVDGAEAYAAGSGGRIAILGLAPGEGIVGLFPAGFGVRESAGNLLGEAFFLAGESGSIQRFAERGPLQGSVSPGGTYSAITMSPEGSYAYALNYTGNRVDVVDAQGLIPVVVSDFATGVDPVDIATGSAGRYIYVATAHQNVLEVYDSRSGVTLTSVSPRSGRAGTLITIAGSGFDPVPGNNGVTINGTAAGVVASDPAGTRLLVQAGSGTSSGPVQVTAGGEISNTISYLSTTRDATPFSGLGVVNDTSIGDLQKLILSPDDRWLFGMRADGSLVAIQANPVQPGYLRPVQDLSPAQTGVTGPGEMVMTPDGKKLYVGVPGASKVAVFQVSGSATAPLARTGTVQNASGDALIGGDELTMMPDGSRLLVASDSQGAVWEVATENDSLLYNGVLNPMNGFVARPQGLVVDPRGDRLYAGDSDLATTLAHSFDLVPTSSTYRQQGATYNLSGVGTLGPYQLAVSPNGNLLYCLVAEPLALNTEYRVAVVDVDRASATFGQVLTSHAVALDTQPILFPNRTGTQVFVLNRNAPGGLSAYTGDGLFTGPVSGPGSARLTSANGLVTSLDDARLYTGALGGGIYLTDVSGVNTYNLVSGDNQIGVVDQPLAAPFVVRTLDAGNAPLPGVPVRLSALQGTFESPTGNATVVTDAGGQARATMLNGSSPGNDVASLTSGGGTLQFFVTVLGDTSLLPPQVLSVVPTSQDQPGVSTNVAIDFSKSINTATLAGNLSLAGGGQPVPVSTILGNGNRRVVLDPVNALQPSTAYTLTVGPGIQDLSANLLTNPGPFTFTTGAALPLALSAIQAPSGRPGDVVVLSGTGFAADPNSNAVIFPGNVRVTPAGADPGALRIVVPGNAVSGDVAVEVNAVTSNALPFKVLGPLSPVNEVTNVISVPTSGQSIAILPNGTRAYMTSPNANTVVPVLLSTGKPETAISVGVSPFGVAPAPNSALVYVSNFLSNTVSVIGTDPLLPGFHKVIHTINTGKNPAGLAVNPDGRTLYVCNYGDATLRFIDIDPNSGTYNSAKADIAVGSSSKSVTVTPDGGSVVVGTATAVLVLDAGDGSAKADIAVGSSSKSVTVTPDGAFALALLDNNTLVLIDIRDGVPDDERAKAEIAVGSTSKSVTVSPDGAYAYVTQGNGTLEVYQIIASGGQAATAEKLSSLYQLKLVATVNVGENPEGLAFDPVSGYLLVVNSGDNTITFINATSISAGPVAVDVDVDPNTLNPTSKGKYISAALEFPTYLDPMDVVLSSVLIDSTVAADTTVSALTDKDGDGIQERELKFKRIEVIALYTGQTNAVVHVTGIIDGRAFAGQDTIRILAPKVTHPHAGSIAAQGSPLEIRWEPMPNGAAHHMDILWSRDLGETWESIVVGTADDSSYVWTVPGVPSSRKCLLMLVAKGIRNDVLGVGVMTEPFTVSDAPTGIEDRLPVRFALLPAAPNPFAAGTQIRFELPDPTEVTIRVFGLDGSVVRTLVDRTSFPAGRHAVSWDGRNERGTAVSGGVYFLKVAAGKIEAVQKIVRVTR